MYPLMMNLAGKSVLVVGGGVVAERKIRKLLSEKAIVTVVSPTLHQKIDPQKIRWQQRNYQQEDLMGATLIFACTNDQQVNEEIKKAAHPYQWVNVTSNKQISEFYNMAVIQENGLTIGISTQGNSPMRSKKFRQELEKWLSNYQSEGE